MTIYSICASSELTRFIGFQEPKKPCGIGQNRTAIRIQRSRRVSRGRALGLP